MTTPPWSHSRLDAFENCERQFHAVSVAKLYPNTQSEQMIWGERVHKDFELRLGPERTPLPADVAMHEEYLARLEAMPGVTEVERKIALNTSLQPTQFFGDDVWYRGVIDLAKRTDVFAHLVDYKTGKHHAKFAQLKSFALWTFHTYPTIQTVRAEYYWTQLRTTNGETYTRDMIPALWAEFLPKLNRYNNAFKTDTWRAKQSGLCNGWCPVTTCEFWRPKRPRR